MKEALGLTPKRSSKPQVTKIDKHEFSELVKRGSTAEDLGAVYAEAAHVQGLGFAKGYLKHEKSQVHIAACGDNGGTQKCKYKER
uniref:Uncharacterized protein n=1 Tax=Lactuca sativa TaxID=4236 RepID=A0A9R1VW14_LACSA|nr:hypothetical protein LSAT_V11C400161010 [Lactuca sativa]